MADFGEASFIPSLYGQMSTLVCESKVNSDHFYLFKKKNVKRLVIGGEDMHFECVSCNSHGNPMCRATVREGRINLGEKGPSGNGDPPKQMISMNAEKKTMIGRQYEIGAKARQALKRDGRQVKTSKKSHY
uniref:Uncharacterized protein n=1 Tax=Romanomermis culicivorax TaxID=13658 RepID=A0A915HNZ2_ROMCU